jgi:hypothetical protein
MPARPTQTISIQLTNGFTGRCTGSDDLRIPADRPSQILAAIEAMLRETAAPLTRPTKVLFFHLGPAARIVMKTCRGDPRNASLVIDGVAAIGPR